MVPVTFVTFNWAVDDLHSNVGLTDLSEEIDVFMFECNLSYLLWQFFDVVHTFPFLQLMYSTSSELHLLGFWCFNFGVVSSIF
jgi:hypothetical protein